MADDKDDAEPEFDAIDAYLSGQGPPVEVYAGAPRLPTKRPSSLSFPPEVVERAILSAYYAHPHFYDPECTEKVLWDELGEHARAEYEDSVRPALSVIAEYLQSDEVRERIMVELNEFLNCHREMGETVNAVIAAIVGET